MITQRMVGDETKKVKKSKRWKFALCSRVDVMDSSTTAPADSGKPPSSSRKRRFPCLRHFFGKIRSFFMSGKSSSPEQKIGDTKADASCSPAADRSSEGHPEADLPAETQETESVTLVERIRISPSFGSDTSSVRSSAQESREMKPIAESLRFLRPDMELVDLERYSSFGSDTSSVRSSAQESRETKPIAESLRFLRPDMELVDLERYSSFGSDTSSVRSSAQESRETKPIAESLRFLRPDMDLVDLERYSSFGSDTSSVGSFSQESRETIPIAESLSSLRPDMNLLDLERYSSFDTSSVGSAVEQELLQQAILDSLGVQPMGNSQTSAPQGVGTLFGQPAETEQDRATQGDDAGQAALGLPNLGNTCYINAVLQCLLSASPFHDDVLFLREDENEAALLGALSDLCMSRLGDSDFEQKRKILAEIKGTIESHYPQFKGNDQQDAHEFLMALLFTLKVESETLARPIFPVGNMEFKLKRERTCDSCGFQRSLDEDANHLSLVIGPQASLTDSLQQCLNASSIECSCRLCPGTKTSETLKFLSHPQVLVLMVMRFAHMAKLRDRLEIPEELRLTCAEEGRKQSGSDTNSSEDLQRIMRRKKRVRPPTPQEREEAPALIDSHYRLTGVVSHLGSSLLHGHYISHIRGPSEDGWLRCSDTFVRASGWTELSNDAEANGYLLFYVKRY